MSADRWSRAALALLAVLACSACNEQRKQECDAVLAVMRPLDTGTPTVDMVKAATKQLDALKLTDAPLKVYAANYKEKLGVLAGTLEVHASSAAPEGTDAVIAENLKKARTDSADVARYCAN